MSETTGDLRWQLRVIKTATLFGAAMLLFLLGQLAVKWHIALWSVYS